MIDINTFLLMFVYILCMILLVCLIILSIKLIVTINRFNSILDQVDNKIAKFDKAFQLVDIITDNMALISDKLVDVLSNLIRKIFYRKRNENGKEEDENEQ